MRRTRFHLSVVEWTVCLPKVSPPQNAPKVGLFKPRLVKTDRRAGNSRPSADDAKARDALNSVASVNIALEGRGDTLLKRDTSESIRAVMLTECAAGRAGPVAFERAFKLASCVMDGTLATGLWKMMETYNVTRTKYCYDSIIQCSERHPARAHAFFKEMKTHGMRPDVTTYNNLMLVFCRHSKALVFRLWDVMREEGIQCNARTYRQLLKVCDSMEEYLMVKAFMLKHNGKGAPMLSVTTLCGHAIRLSRSVEEAQTHFDKALALRGMTYVVSCAMMKTCTRFQDYRSFASAAMATPSEERTVMYYVAFLFCCEDFITAARQDRKPFQLYVKLAESSFSEALHANRATQPRLFTRMMCIYIITGDFRSASRVLKQQTDRGMAALPEQRRLLKEGRGRDLPREALEPLKV
ncbi:hypothetical protein DIPPA_08775 [Diplonema papillatum]|nr:hypothetical protein DIPPA_08775 [Diplonema papillatum]